MSVQYTDQNIYMLSCDAVVVEEGSCPLHMLYEAAGEELCQAREAFGELRPGAAAVFPGFRMDAGAVLFTKIPVREAGPIETRTILRSCYLESLKTAGKCGFTSIAFPLLGVDSRLLSTEEALEIAMDVFGMALMEMEIKITLVIRDRNAIPVPGTVLPAAERGIQAMHPRQPCLKWNQPRENPDSDCPAPMLPPPVEPSMKDWIQLSARYQASFSRQLQNDLYVYAMDPRELRRRANLDRALFDRICSDDAFHPSKTTAVALALAMSLDASVVDEFIARAGYALNHSALFDILISAFLAAGESHVLRINAVLFRFGLPQLGGPVDS